MTNDFTELDRLLRRIGAPVDAAECHGALCGAVCAPGDGIDAWLEHTLEGVDSARRGDAPAALRGIAEQVRRQLRGRDMAFAPMLPDDDEPLAARAASLGEWCEGFLFGIGTARITDFDRYSDTIQEALRDLVEIARVGVPADGDEDDEAAYLELVEYLRVAVQLVHDEFNPAPAPTEVPGPSSIH